MKRITLMTLMITLGIASLCADPGPANMTLSGTAAWSTITLGGTAAGEYNLAGTGTLGPFTFRIVSTSVSAPQPSNSCLGPTKLYFTVIPGGGAGVLSSQDGSTLTLNLTGGGDCLDFLSGNAICTRIFQVIDGIGRYKNVSGTVTLNMTVTPVLLDGSPTKPVFFAVTGDVTGIVPESHGHGSQDGQL
jgi:hypothetical protein